MFVISGIRGREPAPGADLLSAQVHDGHRGERRAEADGQRHLPSSRRVGAVQRPDELGQQVQQRPLHRRLPALDLRR